MDVPLVILVGVGVVVWLACLGVVFHAPPKRRPELKPEARDIRYADTPAVQRYILMPRDPFDGRFYLSFDARWHSRPTGEYIYCRETDWWLVPVEGDQ